MADDRRIFAYTVGGQKLFGDPLALHRTLVRALDGDPNAVLREAYPPEHLDDKGQPRLENGSESLARLDALERVTAAARTVFSLPPVDPTSGAGVTEKEAEDLLLTFLDWLAAKKKPDASTPT
jgi:hypothetical protein